MAATPAIPLSAEAARGYIQQMKSLPFFTSVDEPGSLPARIRYYERRAPGKRVYFRVAGVLVIGLSTLLPVLASFGQRWMDSATKDLWVAVVAAMIALLTGLNSFYRWDATWRAYTQALFTLYAIRREWESQCARVEALLESDPRAAVEALESARDRAIADTDGVVQGEMQEYFSRQSFPESKPASRSQ